MLILRRILNYEAQAVPDITALSRRSILFLPLALAACKPGSPVVEVSGSTMGTHYAVAAIDHDRKLSGGDMSKAIESALADVNDQMSNWREDSEVTRFNTDRSTAALPVSSGLAKVVEAAQDVHLASDGQFDITLGPLIELWGFGAHGKVGQTPSDAEIADALRTTGQSRTLRVGNGMLQKLDPGTAIYLSAIGKGYGVDRIAQALAELGVTDYLVEIGGDLYSSGRNPDGLPWQIGIESPDARDQSLQKIVGISNMGMATSGDYRNYFEMDGVRYSHILDAHTGRPVTHTTASATVLTDNAMLADAWATAMLILGRERGLQIAETEGLATLFVERDPNASNTDFVATASSQFSKLVA